MLLAFRFCDLALAHSQKAAVKFGWRILKESPLEEGK